MERTAPPFLAVAGFAFLCGLFPAPIPGAFGAGGEEAAAAEETGILRTEDGGPAAPGEAGSPDAEPSYDGDPFREEAAAPHLADPIEPINRVFFVFNDKAYFWVLRPVAKGYRAVVPKGVRVSVRNFFSNLLMPVRLVNNLLQGKIGNVGVELSRFTINTTVGIGGLFDPAKNHLHLEPRTEDLGQTFGRYGLGHGFYIVLPLLGPARLRDGIGRAGDAFLDPVNYVGDVEDVLGVQAFRAENDLSLRIGEYEDLKKSSIDPYLAVRDAYSQYRARQVRE